MKTLRLAFLAIALAGCVAPGPERVSARNPTVSYSYSDGQIDRATQDAARYCFQNFDERSARLIDDVRRGGERVATFECVERRR